MLASSLIGVLAQRLVRLLCPSCKSPYEASQADCRKYGLPDNPAPTLYKGDGCKQCNYTGYRGRTAIFELVDIDDRMRTMIHDGTSEQELENYARSRSPSIYQDGMRRIMAGDTSLEEVLRVTHED